MKKKKQQKQQEQQKQQKQQRVVLSEEDLYEKEEAKEETIQLVVFRLAKEWYGVELEKAKEIAKVEKITYLPSSPNHIAGIVSLRGSILSVTDLREIFGLSEEKLAEESRLVVIGLGGLETGLLVDEVCEVVEVLVEKIDPTLTTIPLERAKYIEGGCRIDNKLTGILNVERVLKHTDKH